jgi:hypothetical protein
MKEENENNTFMVFFINVSNLFWISLPTLLEAYRITARKRAHLLWPDAKDLALCGCRTMLMAV